MATSNAARQAGIIAGYACRYGLKIATVESCTGGMVAAALTEHVGASEWFLGGIVAYANDFKRELLTVPAAVLQEHGAVSAESACAMCAGLAAFGATAGLAITGIAGPGGGSADKPVGTVWFGFFTDSTAIHAVHHCFSAGGGRHMIRQAATEFALEKLAALLAPPSESN